MELLICIAVLAILLAIILPMVNRARAQARVVVCTNNLQQIGTSFRSWGQTREMRLPGTAAWVGAVTSTVKTDKILWCPDGPEPKGPSAFGNGPIIDYHPNNNNGHPTDPTKISDDHFTLTTKYQKNKAEYALFDFVRVEGNLWKMKVLHMDPRKPYGGPPIDIYSSNGTVYKDVQKNVEYLVTIGDAGTGGSTYGFNSQFGQKLPAKGGRLLAVDFDNAKLEFDTNGLPTASVPARHFRTKANVLFTDGSVVLEVAKSLQGKKLLFEAN